MTIDYFVKHECLCCGGNWTKMFLTGIESAFPEVYAQMPDITYDFGTVSFIASYLCDHDETNQPEEVSWSMNCTQWIVPIVKAGVIQFMFVPFTEDEKDIPVKDLIAYGCNKFNR